LPIRPQNLGRASRGCAGNVLPVARHVCNAAEGSEGPAFTLERTPGDRDARNIPG